MQAASGAGGLFIKNNISFPGFPVKPKEWLQGPVAVSRTEAFFVLGSGRGRGLKKARGWLLWMISHLREEMMNPVRILLMALGALAATLILVIPIAVARRMTAARRIRYHAGKAVEALKDLTSEQRDEALDQAKATMKGLDDRIDDLRKTLYEKWGQMDQATRDRTRLLLDSLSRERNQVSQWYGAMMQSSAQAWDDVKAGFMKSFTDLSASFHKAQKEFS